MHDGVLWGKRPIKTEERSGALPLDQLSSQRPRAVLTAAGPSPGLPGGFTEEELDFIINYDTIRKPHFVSEAVLQNHHSSPPSASRPIRYERLAHILDHPEMQGMEKEIELVLHEPQLVRRSRSDEAVGLFYVFYAQTLVGGKWLCVVVKKALNKLPVRTEVSKYERVMP
ncbi:MAG: hypothetical protein ACREYE_16190 [Gammaproteobacteria bacterium]